MTQSGHSAPSIHGKRARALPRKEGAAFDRTGGSCPSVPFPTHCKNLIQ
jgi:hypothetical protein